MDVEFFLLIFGALVIFSFLYTLVFLKPVRSKKISVVFSEAPNDYASPFVRFAQLCALLVLFGQSISYDKAVSAPLAALILTFLILGNLTK